ncbi:S-adenosyl-L-methionine-dependent methyltransferase [Aureobasidium pullulans]|nr:S-adenosyl-L-methionine-dependent methyltransferase [Aureobasidium pullulans]
MRRPSSVAPDRTGTHHQPIMIDDDDDDYMNTNMYNMITIDDKEGNPYDTITIEDDNIDDDDVEFISERTPVTDNDARWGAPQSSSPASTPKRRPKRPFVVYEPRTKPIVNTAFLEAHWVSDKHCVVPGLTVELRIDPSAPFKCGDFLRIESIFEDLDTKNVYLRGILFRRARTLEGMLPKKLNEVYQVLQHNLGDSRPIHTQSLHDVPVNLATGIRGLRHTNALFPQNSFRTFEDMTGRNPAFVQANAGLTCRWKRVFQYTNATDLVTGYPHVQSLERLTDAECDEGLAIPDFMLRRAVPEVDSDLSVVDLTAEEAASKDAKGLADILGQMGKMRILDLRADSAFTFADFFCGAGGVSVGAKMSGFKILYAVDHDKDACSTYRLNFPGTQVFEESIHDNLTCRKQNNAHVRCCHMSTVCKTVSTAYTVRGKNHDANEATLFCISDILRKATPMVATLEQTFGALNKGKKQIFNDFVWQFTSMNYSVKWAVHTLSEYGVPQARKRLIMLGACPGHPLPDFPLPTHSPSPANPVVGLRPSVTIADALQPIRHNTPNHNPGNLDPKDFLPYSPHQLVRGCITTSGGLNNWHYSGKRHYTEREFACFQTFPLDHVFIGNRTSVVQQVGNAVPPAFSSKLYASIRKCFEEVDEEDRERVAPIDLTHDDDDVDVDIEQMMKDERVVMDLT